MARGGCRPCGQQAGRKQVALSPAQERGGTRRKGGEDARVRPPDGGARRLQGFPQGPVGADAAARAGAAPAYQGQRRTPRLRASRSSSQGTIPRGQASPNGASYQLRFVNVIWVN